MQNIPIRKSDRIYKVKLDDDYTYLGRFGSLMMYAYIVDGEILVRLLEPTDKKLSTCVGVIDLFEDFEGVYGVGMVRIASPYQGFDLAPKMYRMVMKKLSISISTMNAQSLGGQSIWSRIFRRKDIQMLAYRRGKHRPRKLYPVYFDEDNNRVECHEKSIWRGDNEWELVASVV